MLRLSIELVLCLLLVYGWSQHKCKLHWLGRQVKGRWKARREKRFLKAKTPCDCPLCQDKQDQAAPVPDATANYAYEKTKRGRPKRVNSEGFACLNPACRYYLIRSAGQSGRYPALALPRLSMPCEWTTQHNPVWLEETEGMH